MSLPPALPAHSILTAPTSPRAGSPIFPWRSLSLRRCQPTPAVLECWLATPCAPLPTVAAPMVAVSLVHRRGYFRQHLDAVGQQQSRRALVTQTTLPSTGRWSPSPCRGAKSESALGASMYWGPPVTSSRSSCWTQTSRATTPTTATSQTTFTAVTHTTASVRIRDRVRAPR